ncbi:MAG: TetR/AcrR family transcriptional regulator [Hyphomicrobiales bacterium]|nr:TetR/AcrR family transcriptional regulator [Hyphomicrobiales bacterium]MDE1973640.1 TetR/AcrR family transcriptional regulator [Hyphomicrobiales bacterium]MDE2284655.1 TetR/AcrR family transcriptional regulator [Hyphomicrobiales bacterium]MDE2372838.1 TetR/AcrR family transcriptional regulator [Hyphomicrobiales bacterium]
MSDQAALSRPQIGPADDDSAKRRQIVEGARAVFLAHGFDAASMNDIARAAGVSKGTLYVYFKHKEELFEAIVEQECDVQAEGIFDFDPGNHDVGGVLARLGAAYVKFLCRPEKASAIRTVIAIADRMPEIGRKFYESGPERGMTQLADYLNAQIDAGVLVIDDVEIAAVQLMESFQAKLFKPMVFNFAPAPSPEQIERVVRIAVRTFLAAYQVPAKG